MSSSALQSRSSSSSSLQTNNNTNNQRSLQETKQSLKIHSFNLRKLLNKPTSLQNYKEIINSTQILLIELNNDSLKPKEYYDVYISISSLLLEVEDYFKGISRENELLEVYEYCQYCCFILPRLYFMILLGGVFMKKESEIRDNLDKERDSVEISDNLDKKNESVEISDNLDKERDKKNESVEISNKFTEIAKDLLEMCKGIQHPLKGLFLRHYLITTLTKSSLISLSSSFILQNFVEMNKLWVRLQYTGHSRERSQRIEERLELKQLVGYNLVKLSSINSDTSDNIKRVLEQIIVCKDVVAQEYLLEVLVKVYGDLELFSCLSDLLKSLKDLHPKVNSVSLMVGFIEKFTQTSDDLFLVFYDSVLDLIRVRQLGVDDCLGLCNALLKYCKQEEEVEKVLQLIKIDSTTTTTTTTTATNSSIDSKIFSSFLKSIITISLFSCNKLFFILLEEIINKIKDLKLRLLIALNLCEFIVNNSIRLNNVDLILKLFEIGFLPLILDCNNESCGLVGVDEFDFNEFNFRQSIVCKVLLLIDFYDGNNDADGLKEEFLVLTKLRSIFKDGGLRRVEWMIPCLVNKSFLLLRKYKKKNEIREEDTREDAVDERELVYKFMHQTISLLLSYNNPNLNVLALKLFLFPLTEIKNEMIAYEFVVSAFSIYEDCISDSRQQLVLLQIMIGTLVNTKAFKIFNEENYDTLSTKTTVYSSKMLKKEDQCRLILQASFLFDSKRILECLQKSLKLSDSVLDSKTSVSLFLDCFNFYCLHFNRGVELGRYFKGLAELCFGGVEKEREFCVYFLESLRGVEFEGKDVVVENVRALIKSSNGK